MPTVSAISQNLTCPILLACKLHYQIARSLQKICIYLFSLQKGRKTLRTTYVVYIMFFFSFCLFVCFYETERFMCTFCYFNFVKVMYYFRISFMKRVQKTVQVQICLKMISTKMTPIIFWAPENSKKVVYIYVVYTNCVRFFVSDVTKNIKVVKSVVFATKDILNYLI